MKRLSVVLLLAVAMVAAACGANGDTSSDQEEQPTSQESGGGATPTEFGTMDSPCGEDIDGVTATVAPDEAGAGTDKLYIGAANDRTAEARPGLLKEMYDSMVAFAAWCNDQGGIGGLPVEVVDLDGQLFKIEQAMTTACSQTFAMVGGGWVQDNLAFTGKDGSDFHKCGMIAVTGFAVSTDFAGANGVVQPLPNPAYEKPATWIEDIRDQYPDEVKKTTFVYGEGVPSIEINKNQNKAVAEAVGGYGFTDDISYALLNQDFSVTAQKVMDLGATAVNFVGEPENYAALLAELKTKGYEGIAFSDTNEYDEKLFSKGDAAADGAIIRMGIHAFEEADEFPVMQQLQDVLTQYGPEDVKIASLSIQSFSAGLLFAQAAKDCAAANDGEITRQCVVETAQSYTDWDGGGLHVAADLSSGKPPACSMLLQAENGTFVRLSPELGSADDDGDGFHCGETGVIEIQGDFGQGNVDPSRPF